MGGRALPKTITRLPEPEILLYVQHYRKLVQNSCVVPGIDTRRFLFADSSWFEDMAAFRELKANIKANGMKNNIIEYTEIEGEKYILRGNGCLAVAEDLGIEDQLIFQEVKLPFLGYRNETDVI